MVRSLEFGETEEMPPKDPWSAVAFIIESVRFSQADVGAAKQFLSETRGGMVESIANRWVSESAAVFRVWHRSTNRPNAGPQGLRTQCVSQFGHFRATWSLVQSGVLVPLGATRADQVESNSYSARAREQSLDPEKPADRVAMSRLGFRGNSVVRRAISVSMIDDAWRHLFKGKNRPKTS